jgi:hypothetical protein
VSPVESLLAPVDALRSAVLAVAGRALRPWIRSRDLRVSAYAIVAGLAGLALCVVAPLWLLALGPLVLGVAHLVSDVRYLVARRGFHRRWPLALSTGLVLLAVSFAPRFAVGALAPFAAILCARAPLGHRALALAAWTAVYLSALAAGPVVDYVFAHAHNVVAIALWATWRPRGSPVRWAVLSTFALGVAALSSGLFDPLMARLGSLSRAPAELDLATLTRSLAAPWMASHPRFALRLTLVFAFAQSMHYAVWLRLLPEDDRGRAGVRSFVSSYRALREDLGGVALAVSALLAFALVPWSLRSVAQARDGYLSVAVFHGYLELAVGALFLLEGSPGAADTHRAPARTR